MFDAHTSSSQSPIGGHVAPRHVNFGTPADPEAGWAARNPDRALLFLFVSPRECGAVEELMAL